MLEKLQQIILEPKKAFLLFDETQESFFLTYALPLLQSGFSVGVVSSSIIQSLQLNLKESLFSGVYTLTHHHITSPSILCFSSGTKNTQKGIIRTFESWQQSFMLIQQILVTQPQVIGVVFGAIPYSLSLFGIMESLFRGQKPLTLPKLDKNKLLNLQQDKNYLFWITPFHATSLIDALKRNHILPVASVKFVFVGGATFSNIQRNKLQAVFPNAAIYSFFGASETSFISIKTPDDESDSVGTLCQDVEVQLHDEQNQPLPTNEVGTIWVKSKQLFLCYLQKDLIISKLNDFISIGDRGLIDAKNRLFFKGRLGRQLSIRGHIIDLDVLENWFKSTLEVEQLVLLARPNPSKENELMLITSKKMSPKEWLHLKEVTEQTLGPQGVPKKWIHCSRFPLLENGKIDVKKMEQFV